ncbi:hypothetical protein EKD16_24145 [Streptomonospora litoralis]|uniref:Uncharacterized protein n=1 Tax=Streptomonospora litoralis TaxID=2498135 RepID=A0A4P6QAR3_9ACTN|nr:hypothetical protein EKD16_24145 [Streptomonospora litoralis]
MRSVSAVTPWPGAPTAVFWDDFGNSSRRLRVRAWLARTVDAGINLRIWRTSG